MATRCCPYCGSPDGELVLRSLTRAVVQPHQFWLCRRCGRKAYEIISCTGRELRLYMLEPGKTLTKEGQKYIVQRVLRAGDREYLVYVRPCPTHEP